MTPQDKKGGEQLSDMQIRELLRPHVPKAIAKMVSLMESTNENVALGASRDVISRFVPALRSVEFSPGENDSFTMKVEYVSKQDTSKPTRGAAGNSK